MNKLQTASYSRLYNRHQACEAEDKESLQPLGRILTLHVVLHQHVEMHMQAESLSKRSALVDALFMVLEERRFKSLFAMLNHKLRLTKCAIGVNASAISELSCRRQPHNHCISSRV